MDKTIPPADTKTGLALQTLNDEVMLESRGMRPNVPQNVILFTDGKPRDETTAIAKELKQKFNVRIHN